MGSAVSNQPDLSTTYKPEATMVKAVNCEVGKWEKGEVRQHLTYLVIFYMEDVCPLTTYNKD